MIFLAIYRSLVTHADLKSCSDGLYLSYKLHSSLRASIRCLIPIATVTVIMDDPDLIDLLFLKPGTAETDWSESNVMTNDAEMLDTFAICQ